MSFYSHCLYYDLRNFDNFLGQFQAFNYDNDLDNFKRYGSYQPPDYDLSKITAPVRMWYSTGDQLINYKVHYLSKCGKK